MPGSQQKKKQRIELQDNTLQVLVSEQAPAKKPDNDSNPVPEIPNGFRVHGYDIRNHIAHYLLGPYVEIITETPSEKEKIGDFELLTEEEREKIALKLRKKKALRLNAYLLIQLKDSAWQIGFRRKNTGTDEIEYVQETVGWQSRLYIYLQDWYHVELGITRDTDLIAYVEKAIRSHKGDVEPQLQSISRLSGANQYLHHFIQKAPDSSFYLKEQLLKTLLRHVTRGEEDEAERILKSHPYLLLSKWKAEITDGSLVRDFKPAATIKHALWGYDLHMWKMMLSCIPEEKKAEYYADLLNQLIDLKKNGLEYTLNNLKTRGLRILRQDPTEEEKQDAIAREAYHFIQTNKGSFIGFFDPKTKQYVQRKLENDSDLKFRMESELERFDRQNPDEPSVLKKHPYIGSFDFILTRDKELLLFAEKEILKHGGRTHITKKESFFNFGPSQKAKQNYMAGLNANWVTDRLKLYWSMIVGTEDRLQPISFKQEKFRHDRPFDLTPKFNEESLPRGNKDYHGYFAAPVFDDEGFVFGYVGGVLWTGLLGVWTGAGGVAVAPRAASVENLLAERAFCEVRTKDIVNLEKHLSNPQQENIHQNSDQNKRCPGM